MTFFFFFLDSSMLLFVGLSTLLVRPLKHNLAVKGSVLSRKTCRLIQTYADIPTAVGIKMDLNLSINRQRARLKKRQQSRYEWTTSRGIFLFLFFFCRWVIQPVVIKLILRQHTGLIIQDGASVLLSTCGGRGNFSTASSSKMSIDVHPWPNCTNKHIHINLCHFVTLWPLFNATTGNSLCSHCYKPKITALMTTPFSH